MTGTGDRPAQGILDTSAVIAMRQITDPAALPAEPMITTVTLAELSAGPLVARNDQERAARQAHLQQAEADFDPLPFDRAAARSFGQVAASLPQSGRKSTARAFDALIAATALANHLPVYTCNAADFEGIDGLDVVPVAPPQKDAARLAHGLRRWPEQVPRFQGTPDYLSAVELSSVGEYQRLKGVVAPAERPAYRRHFV